MAEQIVNVLAEIGKASCLTIIIVVVFLFIVSSRSNKE